MFRDFVEKLERAYIAFDGVVGSCLGRAWGGTNHAAERTTTLTLFRKTRNPISRNAPSSLSLSLSLSLASLRPLTRRCSYPPPFADIFSMYFTRVASAFFISIQHHLRREKESERDRKSLMVHLSAIVCRESVPPIFPSLPLPEVLSFLPSFIFQPVPYRVVLPLGWYQF